MIGDGGWLIGNGIDGASGEDGGNGGLLLGNGGDGGAGAPGEDGHDGTPGADGLGGGHNDGPITQSDAAFVFTNTMGSEDTSHVTATGLHQINILEQLWDVFRPFMAAAFVAPAVDGALDHPAGLTSSHHDISDYGLVI
jgi:hypothetical protein